MASKIKINDQRQVINSSVVSLVFAFIGIVLSVLFGLFLGGANNILRFLLVFLGIIVFLFTLIKIELGLVGLVVLLYSQAYLLLSKRYGLPDVVQGLLALLCLSAFIRLILSRNDIPREWVRPAILIGLYCVVGFASVYFAENQEIAFYIAVETLKSGAIAFVILWLIEDFRSLRLIVWGLLFVGIFLASLNIFQYLTGTYANDYGGFAQATLENISGDIHDFRAGGPVQQPNTFAQMLLVLIPMSFERFFGEKNRLLKIFAGVAFVLCSFAVILTYSRTGFLVLAVIIFAVLLLFRRGNVGQFITIAILALIILNFLPSRFSERLQTLTELVPSVDSGEQSAGYVDYSFRGRNSEMIVAVQMFVDNPLLGVGLGNYPVLYQKYAQRVGLELRADARYAHSLYLEVLSETGIIGMTCFIMLLLGALIPSFRWMQLFLSQGMFEDSNMIMALILSFVAYLLASVTMHSVYPRNFWVLIGVVLSIPRVVDFELAEVKGGVANFFTLGK